VNLKFPIPTTQHKLESWLLYFEECGYEVVKKEIGQGCTVWTSNAPGYGKLTPIAEKFPNGGGRFGRVLYVRLPDSPPLI
jgi:hypothetical protein